MGPIPGLGAEDFELHARLRREYAIDSNSPVSKAPQRSGNLCQSGVAHPGGSVKDRPGLRIIADGERSGRLTWDKIILNSTSGNTGIAYAMIGAIKGYKVEIVVPANISEERKRTLNEFGISSLGYSSYHP